MIPAHRRLHSCSAALALVVLAGVCSTCQRPRTDTASEPIGELAGKLSGASWETHARWLEPRTIGSRSGAADRNGAADPGSARRSYALDRQIDVLQARLAENESWQVLNDLSVASLERWRLLETGAGLVESLEYAARARQLSENPTTLYNLALVASELGLEQGAIETWERFAQVADEVAIPENVRRLVLVELERLQEKAEKDAREQDSFGSSCVPGLPELDPAPLTPESADRVRLRTECGLLFTWSAADASDDPDLATRALAAGLAAGERLESVRNGDSYVADVYRYLTTTTDPRSKDAHLGLAKGIRAYEKGDYAEAVAMLREAAPVLTSLGSPAEFLARLFLARGTFYFDVSQSEAITRETLARIDETRYPNLAGRLRIQLADVLAISGRNLDALNERLRSQELLSRGWGSTLATYVDALLADDARELGNFRSAWTYRIRVSRAESTWRSPAAEHSLLSQFVQAMSEEGYPFSARFAGREILHHAAYSKNRGQLLVFTNLVLALSVLELGDDGAMDHVRKARDIAALVAAEDFSWIETSLDSFQAQALYPVDPVAAEKLFADAIAAFEKEGNEFELEISLLGRAKGRSAKGDLDGAHSDFERLVQLIEARRGATQGETKVTSLIRAQSAFDGLTRVAVQRGNPHEALEVAEKARARYLLDLVPKSDFEIATVDYVLAATPSDTAMIFFSILEDGGLLAWTIADGSLGLREVAQGGVEVTRLARRYRNLLESGVEGEEETNLARELYRLLFGPGGSQPEHVHRLVVIPDRALFRVPFGALISPDTGHRLLEDVSIVVSPSLSLLTKPSSSREHRATSRALLVMEPHEVFSDRLGWFPPLPGVDREKEGLESVYPDMTIVQGADLPESSLARLLADTQVFHFAGHSVESDGRPEGTGLLLSRSDDSAALWSFDQLPQDLVPPELIFLSSCHSMGGYRPDREGVLGLASFLFARGGAAVVGSLWSTRDDVAPDVAVNFHRHYQQGSSAADALRSTVLELGIDKVPVHAWSNYIVMEKVF